MVADLLLASIADYARGYAIESAAVLESARCGLLESLSKCLEASSEPACAKLLGPIVPGAVMPGGARVPGTSLELDPVHAAFNIGTLVRWSDCADDGGASESGHSADCVGAVLAVADYLARRAVMQGRPPPLTRAALTALIKAQEIQGSISLASRNAGVALGSLLPVRVASAAVATALLGGTEDEIVSALSHAWIDGAGLSVEMHPRGRGTRRLWAAADAASRGVRFAFLAIGGDEGYPTALSAPGWGAYEVLCGGRPLELTHPLGSRIVEQTLRGRTAAERLLLLKRLRTSIDRRFPPRQAERVKSLFTELRRLDDRPVNELIAALVANGAVR
jgi:2-methylcitrate dehydratase PrpD